MIAELEVVTTIASNLKGLTSKSSNAKKPAKVRLRFHENSQTLELINTGDSEAINIRVSLIE